LQLPNTPTAPPTPSHPHPHTLTFAHHTPIPQPHPTPPPPPNQGCCNLARHIKNATGYGIPVVVAINAFSSDAPAELAAVRAAALDAGAFAAVVTRHHALGGAGAVELARAVVEACAQPTDFKFLYDAELSIKVGGWGAWVGGGL